MTRDGAGAHALLAEWNVATARPTFTREIFHASDKTYLGEPVASRIAASGERLFVATELEHGDRLVLDAFDRRGEHVTSASLPVLRSDVHRRIGENQVEGTSSTELAIAASGAFVAVAYRPYPHVDPSLHLFHAGTLAPAGATSSLRADTLASGRRARAIVFVQGRLFVAEQPSATVTRVSELRVPSLAVARTFVNHHAPTDGGGTQLVPGDDGAHLHLLDRGELVTLDADLVEERRSAILTDDVAVSRHGRVLTSVGLDAPGVRFDAVPSLGADASCTPVWANAHPLLACAVDMQGALVARLPPVFEGSDALAP